MNEVEDASTNIQKLAEFRLLNLEEDDQFFYQRVENADASPSSLDLSPLQTPEEAVNSTKIKPILV